MLAQDAEGVGSWTQTQAVSSRRRADDAGDMTDDEQHERRRKDDGVRAWCEGEGEGRG